MATLFEIQNEFEQLYQMAIDEELDDQAFNDTLESITAEFELKASGYANVIKQIEMEADQAELLEKEFKAKKEIRKKSVKRLKDAVKWAMVSAKVTEVDAGKFKFKLKNNGGKQPMQIVDEVPDNFKRLVYEDDNELIRKHLEAGEELGFAYLEPRGQHVELK